MVTHISVHQDDILSVTFLHTINVCSAKTHLTWPFMQYNLLLVYLLQLFGHSTCAIRTIVLDDHHFNIKALFFSHIENEPYDDRQVVSLVVSGQDD